MSWRLSEASVADTGPLIELSRLGYLDSLPALFARVLMPPAVRAELRSVEPPGWLEEAAPDPEATAQVLREVLLGRGEAEAIALAAEHSAWVLLDDRKARRYARSRGLTVVGTLGLLVAVHRHGLARRDPVADIELLKQGLWVSPELLDSVLEQMRGDSEAGPKTHM